MYQKKARIWATVVLAVVLAASALSGCSQPAPAEPGGNGGKEGGTVLLRLTGEVTTFNPLTASDGVSGTVLSYVREPLGYVDYDGTWDARLAESYTVSEDGLEFTFNLRKGVKWHDGETLDADDVIFTANLMMNEEANIPIRPRFILGGEPVRWEKVDEYTVKMIVPQRNATILDHLRHMYIVPEHLLKDVPPAEFKNYNFLDNLVMTGPFKLAEYKTGEYVRLVRFDDYWDGKPYLDEVVLRIVPDQAAAIVALESGQIDATAVTPEQAIRLREKGELNVYQAPGSGIEFICLNNRAWPFDDARVRKAMNHAIDKDTICEKVYLGFARPAWSYTAADVMFLNEDVVEKYEYDLDKAAAILADAGWEKGSDGILVKDGKKFEFELNYRSGSLETEQLLLIYQADLAKIGIKMNLRALEASAMTNILIAGSDPLPYQAMHNGVSPGIDPDNYALIYHSSQYPSGKNGFNYVGYLNPEVDRCFDEGKLEMDPAQRAKYYEDIQKMISEDAVIVPLIYKESVSAATKRLHMEDAWMLPDSGHRFPKPQWLWVEK